MSWKEIDFIFPFVVFGYGMIMTLVLNSPRLMELAENRISEPLLVQFKLHRGLGLVCLILGGLWSAQNVLLA